MTTQRYGWKETDMGRIMVHEFISLDGVNESPSWTAPYPWDPKMGDAIGRLTGPAILLGRNTWEMFAQAWPQRTAEDDPGAPFFNDTPKYVVSSTRQDAEDWRNSEILGPYDPAAIQELKDRVDGNIYVSGSTELVRALLDDGLVDELHLFVFPLALGSGKRLFAEGSELKLALTETETYESGVVHVAYGPTD